MVMWILILVAVSAVLIVLGLVFGAGSRAARRKGMDSAPAAKVRVVERPH